MSVAFARFVVMVGVMGALLAPTPAAASTGPDFGAVDAFVQRSTQGVPGVAYVVVRGDQILHVKGFGSAGASGPVSGNTVFPLGSVSKSVTALAVMQLVEQGAVELDAPVQRYLPWFATADGPSPITIRELLNQTSGLSRQEGDPVGALTSIEDHVRGLASVHLAHAPGGTFIYSNANYEVLGLIVQVVARMPYVEYVQRKIFDPLQMTNSWADESAAVGHGLSDGHIWWFGAAKESAPYVRPDYAPAGFLTSSAADMAHYLIAQLNGGRYGDNSILSAAGISEMQRGAAAERPGVAYGMGWEATQVNGTQVIQHDGSVFNSHAQVVLIPSAGWGIAVFLNADSALMELAGLPDTVGYGIGSMLMGWAAQGVSPFVGYAAFDGLAGLLVLLQLFSIARTRRIRPALRSATAWFRHVIWPLIWPLIPIGLVVSLSFAADLKLGAVVLSTDLGWWTLATAVLLITSVAARTTLVIPRLARAPRPGPRVVPGASLEWS
jgi:CubicO group peptidase (beta-lactamase class C family)